MRMLAMGGDWLVGVDGRGWRPFGGRPGSSVVDLSLGWEFDAGGSARWDDFGLPVVGAGALR